MSQENNQPEIHLVTDETVQISKQEYEYLQGIVIDVGNMFVKGEEIFGEMFQFLKEAGIDWEKEKPSASVVAKILLKRPRKFMDMAQKLAPAVLEFAPYYKKYGPYAHQMIAINERSINTPALNAPGSEPEPRADRGAARNDSQASPGRDPGSSPASGGDSGT